jgi:hypothetical protein
MYIFVYDNQYIVVKLPNYSKMEARILKQIYSLRYCKKVTLYKPMIQHNIFNVWGNKTMENYKNIGLESHHSDQKWTPWSSW